MARSKHRPTHKDALAARKIIAALKERVNEAGRPKEVGRNKYRIETDLFETPHVDITPERFERQALMEFDGKTYRVGIDTDGSVTIPDGVDAPKKGSPIMVSGFFEAPKPKKLRGPAVLTDYISEIQHFQPSDPGTDTWESLRAATEPLSLFGKPVGPESLTGADYAPLENRMISQVLKLRLTPEESAAIMGKQEYMSMGCTVEPPVCAGRRAGMSEATAHFEMGVHRDEQGNVVFDEVSLCPGPDPNGVTDLHKS